jgi:ferredoxin
VCEVACPTGAISEPEPAILDTRVLAQDRKRLVWMVVLLPILVIVGAWLGRQFSLPASRLHPTVGLAERLVREQAKPATTETQRAKGGLPSVEDLAMSRAQLAPAELLSTAAAIRRQFMLDGWVFGAWVGLVIGAKLVSLSVRRARTDYEPEHGGCFACARCFEYCPRERVSKRVMVAAEATPRASTELRSV